MWVLEEPLTEVAVLAPGDLEDFLRPGDWEVFLLPGDLDGTLGPPTSCAYCWGDLLPPSMGDDRGLVTGEIE